MGLFRYSGNKGRYIKYYRRPPEGTRRVVEPYLGSGTYLLSTSLPGLGYETNSDVVAMWKWLKGTSPSELKDLYDDVEALKADPKTPTKPDVRLMNLDLGPQTYVRINTTSVLTGQLTAWKIYPQHRLPIEQTIALLPRLKDVEILLGDASQYEHTEGDMLFVDPPYLGTTAGYVEKSTKKSHEVEYRPEDTTRLIAGTGNPVIFTYGDGASTHFPGNSWQKVATRKVPNIRRGGTVDRTEWVSYVNWDIR